MFSFNSNRKYGLFGFNYYSFSGYSVRNRGFITFLIVDIFFRFWEGDGICGIY